jgi:hypothetical protein
MVAASCWAIISQAALKPIDMLVDWLEGVYEAGSIGASR